MKLIARLTDQHDCPMHGRNGIVAVGSRSLVDGRPVAVVGDMTGCGAVIVTGTSACIIDSRPAAHIGSATSHGGVIVSGSSALKA